MMHIFCLLCCHNSTPIAVYFVTHGENVFNTCRNVALALVMNDVSRLMLF